jgi:hypothetical protein
MQAMGIGGSLEYCQGPALSFLGCRAKIFENILFFNILLNNDL